MLQRHRPIGLVVLLALTCLGGCTALGWKFGPGFSCRNMAMFAAEPFIVRRDGKHYLAWTYGRDAFYYSPRYKAIDGRLVFSLQGSSSTGSPAGRYAELLIEGAENLLALRRGGAYWWEPDKSFVKLKIVPADQR